MMPPGSQISLSYTLYTGQYTPYESPSLANRNSRKLGAFDRKYEGKLLHLAGIILIAIEKTRQLCLKLIFFSFESFITYQRYDAYS